MVVGKRLTELEVGVEHAAHPTTDRLADDLLQCGSLACGRQHFGEHVLKLAFGVQQKRAGRHDLFTRRQAG
ncbi:MAG: hypothetical protein O3C40_16590 [Planctomycetota bacterium]|nr:hypothetical protein [Planctomycetota bacterium]